MKPLRIAIVVESTQLPLRAAIEAAARMGARGIQDGLCCRHYLRTRTRQRRRDRYGRNINLREWRYR